MDKRIQMAHRVMDLFRVQPEVKEVALRGSLTEGIPDRYSDIDICVDVSGSDNGRYVYRVIDLMRENLDLHFFDINCSEVPKYYVLNFYPRGVPVFWQVDVVCQAEPHCPSVSQAELRAIQDPVAHLLKAWVCCFKHLVRDPERDETEIRRWLIPKFDIALDGVPALEKMKLMLDEIHRRSDDRHTEFIAGCCDALRSLSES